MMRKPALLCSVLYWGCATAFQPIATGGARPVTMSLEASNRRDLFASAAAAAVVLATAQPAQATYSAYTHREEDWKQRVNDGAIQYSSAKDLRKQLKEIAPMNTSNSALFCPNGPSAAVSPLMENRCGDRMATASVYGRTEDVLGNSIPGFNGGRYTDNMGSADSSNSILAQAGGFPTYKK